MRHSGRIRKVQRCSARGPGSFASQRVRPCRVMSNSCVAPHRHSITFRVLMVLAIFSVLYNVSLQGYESISTGRIAVVVLVAYMLASGRAIYRLRDRVLLLIFLPVPLAIAQFVLVRDTGMLSRFIHLAAFAFVGANIIARLVGDIDELLQLMLTAISLQALVIVYSFFSVDYRVWAEANLALGTNFDALALYRAPGLTGTGGSALSVVQSLGVLVGGLLLHLRRGQHTGPHTYWTLLQMLLCMVSCAFVGRTGLLLSLAFLLLLGGSGGHLLRAGVLAAAVAVPVALMAWSSIEGALPASFSPDQFFDYVLGFLLTGRDASVSDLASMPVPPLSVETFFGTGLISTTDAGNPSGHDSGFVQVYFAMGLIYAIVFYAIYAMVLLRLFRWLPTFLRCVLAGIFIAIEIKEPYLFKYSTLFVLMACYTLAAQGRCRSPVSPLGTVPVLCPPRNRVAAGATRLAQEPRR